MDEKRPELRRGRIVWAEARDKRGFVKSRPIVVLTSTVDLEQGAPIIGVAITTTFRDPPPDDHVPVPWHSRGQTITKLRSRSAAVLSWIVQIDQQEVVDIEGDVPVRLMLAILQRLAMQ